MYFLKHSKFPMSLMKIPKIVTRRLLKWGCSSPGAIGNIYGAALVILVMILRTLSSAIIHNIPRTLHSFQILWLESFFAFSMILLFVSPRLSKILQTQKLSLHIMKAFFTVSGTYFLFEGLRILPLAISSTLSLSSIFFSTFGAFLFFSEKIHFSTFIALILSLLGTTLISEMSLTKCSFSLLYPIFAALCFSISSLISKKIALFDSITISLFWAFLWQFLITTPLCIYNWKPFENSQLISIFCTACIILLTFPLTLQAESFASFAFLSPFKCLRIFFSSLFGWLFFSETLSIQIGLGFLCIFFAYILVLTKKNQAPSYYIQKKKEDAF